jgi:hypothetical protein
VVCGQTVECGSPLAWFSCCDLWCLLSDDFLFLLLPYSSCRRVVNLGTGILPIWSCDIIAFLKFSLISDVASVRLNTWLACDCSSTWRLLLQEHHGTLHCLPVHLQTRHSISKLWCWTNAVIWCHRFQNWHDLNCCLLASTVGVVHCWVLTLIISPSLSSLAWNMKIVQGRGWRTLWSKYYTYFFLGLFKYYSVIFMVKLNRSKQHNNMP